MDPRMLTSDESVVLVGLIAYLIHADSRVEKGEIVELDAIGEEMGIMGIRDAIIESMADYPTLDSMVDKAGDVKNPEVRDYIRTVLTDLAHSDGFREVVENRVLAKLAHVWARE